MCQPIGVADAWRFRLFAQIEQCSLHCYENRCIMAAPRHDCARVEFLMKPECVGEEVWPLQAVDCCSEGVEHSPEDNKQYNQARASSVKGGQLPHSNPSQRQ